MMSRDLEKKAFLILSESPHKHPSRQDPQHFASMSHVLDMFAKAAGNVSGEKRFKGAQEASRSGL